MARQHLPRLDGESKGEEICPDLGLGCKYAKHKVVTLADQGREDLSPENGGACLADHSQLLGPHKPQLRYTENDGAHRVEDRAGNDEA